MDITSILSPERVLFKHRCNSKKRLLESVASHLNERHPTLNAGDLFNALVARERLGSTGIGQGIAIPHCRVSGCTATLGALVSLETPIDFNAIDNQPVDIVFALIVPEDENEDHLHTLAALANVFSQTERQDNIRQSVDRDALYQAMIG